MQASPPCHDILTLTSNCMTSQLQGRPFDTGVVGGVGGGGGGRDMMACPE
jgi:hypothetical protein